MKILEKIALSRIDKEVVKLLKTNPGKAEKIKRLYSVYLAHRGAANGIRFSKALYSLGFDANSLENIVNSNIEDFKKFTRGYSNLLNANPLYKKKKELLYLKKHPQNISSSMLIPDTNTNRMFLKRMLGPMYNQKPSKFKGNIKLDNNLKYYHYGTGKYTDELKFDRKNTYLNSPTGRLINTMEGELKFQPNGQFAAAGKTGKFTFDDARYYADNYRRIGDVPVTVRGEIGKYERSSHPESANEIILTSPKTKKITKLTNRKNDVKGMFFI